MSLSDGELPCFSNSEGQNDDGASSAIMQGSVVLFEVSSTFVYLIRQSKKFAVGILLPIPTISNAFL